MHRVFALLCFVVVIHWLIFPYPSGLLHWYCGNLTIAPVPAKQPWWIWINTSCEFIMNDCITTTKQNTRKPCAYFLGIYCTSTSYYKIMGCFEGIAFITGGATIVYTSVWLYRFKKCKIGMKSTKVSKVNGMESRRFSAGLHSPHHVSLMTIWHYWSFAKESTGPSWIPLTKRSVMCSFDICCWMNGQVADDMPYFKAHVTSLWCILPDISQGDNLFDFPEIWWRYCISTGNKEPLPQMCSH